MHNMITVSLNVYSSACSVFHSEFTTLKHQCAEQHVMLAAPGGQKNSSRGNSTFKKPVRLTLASTLLPALHAQPPKTHAHFPHLQAHAVVLCQLPRMCMTSRARR